LRRDLLELAVVGEQAGCGFCTPARDTWDAIRAIADEREVVGNRTRRDAKLLDHAGFIQGAFAHPIEADNAFALDALAKIFVRRTDHHLIHGVCKTGGSRRERVVRLKLDHRPGDNTERAANLFSQLELGKESRIDAFACLVSRKQLITKRFDNVVESAGNVRHFGIAEQRHQASKQAAGGAYFLARLGLAWRKRVVRPEQFKGAIHDKEFHGCLVANRCRRSASARQTPGHIWTNAAFGGYGGHRGKGMIQIETGLFSGMVMQRRKGDLTEQPITGGVERREAQAISVRVTKGKRVLVSLGAERAVKLKQGSFAFTLRGVPVGGPYSIQLSALDARGKRLVSERYDDVFVGDVWILAGQSNMEGVGWMSERSAAMAPVRAFYMDHQWRAAEDPLHELDKSVVRVHHQLHGGRAPVRPAHIGVGPGVAFGQELYQRTGIPIGLLACAHGGTSMAQWDPSLIALGDGSLYGAAIHKLNLNGGGLSGIYWYQGCSDTNHAEDVENYTPRMQRLIGAFRKDSESPKLPFVLVQLSRFVYEDLDAGKWTSIRESQRLLPTLVAHTATVPAIDLELDDSIHVSGLAMERLGRRSAAAALSILPGKNPGDSPIGLGKCRVIKDPDSGLANVLIDFNSVAGSLKSGSRPVGFSLHTRKLQVNAVVKTSLNMNQVILTTNRTTVDASGLFLAYGYGTDPYCNIVDEKDKSLPAFGPVPLGKPRFLTEFADDVEVSRILPGCAQLHGLKYPANQPKLGFKRRHFGPSALGVFLSVRPEIQAYSGDGLVYFRMQLEAPEKMSGRLWLGYDGPIKIWLNKRGVFFDPKGTNPVSLDEAFAKVELRKGRSEVLVALGTNQGNAWGLVVRFERLMAAKPKSDVSLKLPEFVAT